MADTLTTAQATVLYNKNLAIVHGVWFLTTHTAEYEWYPNEQVYKANYTGGRIVHRWGAHWNGRAWTPCGCEDCERHPDLASQVDIAGYELKEAY